MRHDPTFLKGADLLLRQIAEEHPDALRAMLAVNVLWLSKLEGHEEALRELAILADTLKRAHAP